MESEACDPLRLPEYDVEQHVIPLLNALPDGAAYLHGTAFFINGNGTFLTAGHVLKAAQTDAHQRGGSICLAVRTPGANSGVSSDILAMDFAPAPFDVAIGTTNLQSKSFVRLANATTGAAIRDVMTYGYPESASEKIPGGIVLGCRAHKGYIVRKLSPGQLSTCQHPHAFELSFPIPSALSGAPLVLERPATALEHALMAAPGIVPVIGHQLVDPRFIRPHALHLIGICVGTTEAETVAYSWTEVVDGVTTYSEKKSKVELYGLAHDLLPLADWKPTCLHGATLAETIEPT